MNSPLPPDPFTALGVARDASSANIKSAYRKLILQTHPDKVQDESLRAQKQDEFQRIQQAYEIIGDESKRQEYEHQVKLAKELENAKARKNAAGESLRGGFRFEFRTAAFEVRTAAPPRDYDRVYEQRKASRSFEDDIGYFGDRPTSKKRDGYGSNRRPSRGFDERKGSQTMDDERDRVRVEHERQRAHERGYHSERRRNRDKERRRETDEKYARVSYEEEDDSDRYRYKAPAEETPRRRRQQQQHQHEDEGRRETRSSEETMRKESSRRRKDDDVYESDRKLHDAQMYMERSTRQLTEDLPTRPAPHRSATSTYYIRSGSAAPPSPLEDTVRRSHARRSSDRERVRGTERQRSSRKDSRSTINIVEPPEEESRSRGMPSLPHSTSSPSALRASRRSETMDHVRSSRSEIPPLPRSSTMPVHGRSSSRRAEPVTVGAPKSKSPLMEPFDSGYSSPGTPESPPEVRTSPGPPPAEYIIVEPDTYVARPSRRHEVYVEDDSEDDIEHEHNHRTRSISPTRRGPSDSSRPLFREVTPGARVSSRLPSYTYETSRGSPSLLRKESSTTSRASPPFLRTGSSFASRSPSYLRPEFESHGHKAIYNEVQYSPRDVQYSPKIGREDIVFTDGRRGSDGLGSYRDAAPHLSPSHYVHGPHHAFMRAETSR